MPCISYLYSVFGTLGGVYIFGCWYSRYRKDVMHSISGDEIACGFCSHEWFFLVIGYRRSSCVCIRVLERALWAHTDTSNTVCSNQWCTYFQAAWVLLSAWSNISVVSSVQFLLDPSNKLPSILNLILTVSPLISCSQFCSVEFPTSPSDETWTCV